MNSMFQDLRYGFRVLLKAPGFTIIAILTLALGIGANTAIFTFIDALYLKPLPVAHAQELMRVYAAVPGRSYNEGFSGPEFQLLRDHATSFSALAAETQIAQLHVVAGGGAIEVRGAFVSANYFDLLGVQPRLGRAFVAGEDATNGRDTGAVISNQLWRTEFSSDSAALGAEIHVNGVPVKIIGVAPRDFYGDRAGMPAQIWMLTSMLGAAGYACSDGTYRCTVYDNLLGRLASNKRPAAAQAELRSIIVWSATDWTNRHPQREIVATSANGVDPDQRAKANAQMQLLICVTASLLLIACANLAGLLLSRGVARRKEIAVRLSLGASRGRIIRQLFTESILLAGIAAVFGLWFSFFARNVLSGYYGTDSEGFHHLYDLTLNWRILAYSISIALIAGVFFGLVPAIRASRQDLIAELKDGGSPGGQHAGSWLRNGLVVAQVALSMTLVVSAGLLVRSGFAIERGTNFDPQHVAVVRLRPELIKYTPHQVGSLIHRVMQAVQAAPGVESAAFMEGGEGLVWNAQNGHEFPVSPVGAAQASALEVLVQDVNSTFFSTLRMPILEGRGFGEEDNATGSPVAIVNEALARRFWPRGSALGQLLLVRSKPYQIVGVAANIQPASALQAAEPHLYLSYWQSNATTNGDIRMAVRVAGDPSRELPRIRQVIQSVDPLVPVGEDMTMDEQVSLEYMPVLLGRSVMIFCGFLALVLSAIGVYSVLAFAVRARTREIGIRMALGAEPRDVLRMIVWRGVKLAGIGVTLGVAGALGATYLTRSLIFGVTPDDPWTFAAVAALLIVVALAACYLPARRAMHVDPMVALRYE
ncbi:MAG TPA: ABC transporter permease [Verrucomicrobiae bacterium]|nr:ABC transporter permease [Verrucomicrobiae bacterium]